MVGFLQRLKQRKLVQWAIAYVAFAFALIQVLDVMSTSYAWPRAAMHIAFGVLAVGFVVLLVLAWYHGERGAQRVSGPELLLIALALVIGGGLLWHFARTPAQTGAATTMAATHANGPAAGVAAASASDRRPVGATTSTPTPALPPPAAVAPPIPAKSVAVLPFESLSADKNNAYFADGMQDLILTKLADIGDLKVIARTSTMQYGSHPQNLTLVGQQLGVATILEGSVQKAGKQVLINVQLIDVKTDSHIWAESYTRALDNIFGVEGEVAQKVAKALNAKLTAQETAAVNRIPTTNPQAYTLYLRAQHEMTMRFSAASPAAEKAIDRKTADDLQQAITLDPNFAAAYANLAFEELASTPMNKAVSTQPWMAHARKALALQPDSPMALLTIGIWQFYHGKASPGLRALQQAARLAPGNDLVTFNLSNAYKQMGAWQQADETLHKAVRVDPRNAANYFNAANTSVRLGHYNDARQMLEHALAVSPDDTGLHLRLGDILIKVGDFAGARAQYAQIPEKSAVLDYFRVSGLARAWWLSRNCTQAIKAAQAIKAVQQISPPPKAFNMTILPEELIGRCELMLGNQTGGHATLTHARAAVRAELQPHPRGQKALRHQANLQSHLATIEALLGQRDAALQAINEAIALDTYDYAERRKESGLPRSSDGARISAAADYRGKAEILAHFGDAKGATDILRWLLKAQGTGNVSSPALLRLDPAWDPIRQDPAFLSLLKQYGTASPVAASTAAPAASP